MLVYQRVYHGISLNGRASEKVRVIRPTCQRNPDECGNDHADFPCYTDIAGPSSYKLVYSPRLTPSKYSYMLCHVIYPPLSPVFVDTNQTWLSNGGPYCTTTSYCQMWHSTTQNCGTSKTMVMVLYTIIPPAPSSKILDSTWDMIEKCQLNPIEMGQWWSNYVKPRNHSKS